MEKGSILSLFTTSQPNKNRDLFVRKVRSMGHFVDREPLSTFGEKGHRTRRISRVKNTGSRFFNSPWSISTMNCSRALPRIFHLDEISSIIADDIEAIMANKPATARIVSIRVSDIRIGGGQ